MLFKPNGIGFIKSDEKLNIDMQFDLETAQERTSQLVKQGLLPSQVVRQLFREFGEFSSGYLIMCFSKAYDAFGIGAWFAAYWPDAADSISDQEFNEGLLRAIERDRVEQKNAE